MLLTTYEAFHVMGEVSVVCAPLKAPKLLAMLQTLSLYFLCYKNYNYSTPKRGLKSRKYARNLSQEIDLSTGIKTVMTSGRLPRAIVNNVTIAWIPTDIDQREIQSIISG